MHLQLSNKLLLPDLVAFLRAGGCLACLVDDVPAVFATVPDLVGLDETEAIRGLADQWRFAHPMVEVTVAAD
jgi:hypothetical protein